MNHPSFALDLWLPIEFRQWQGLAGMKRWAQNQVGLAVAVSLPTATAPDRTRLQLHEFQESLQAQGTVVVVSHCS